MRIALPLLLSLCACDPLFDGDDNDDRPYQSPWDTPDELPSDDSRDGDCHALNDRWSGRSGAQINCMDIVPLDRFVADRLTSLWGHQASAICAYDSVQGPIVGMNTRCGPMTGPGAFACPADGNIAYDRPFMADQYNRHGDFAVVTILAHEWGHVLQGATGISYDPSVANIQKELHADCQAGVFAAFETEVGNLDQSDVQEAFRSLCEFGDPMGTQWFDAQAHGSCTDRVNAFRYGFDKAGAALEDLCGPRPLEVMRRVCG
jgi:hypothetical protein